MLEQSPRPFLIGLDFSSQMIQREQQFFESLPQRREATGHSCFRLGFGTDFHPRHVVQVIFCQLQAWAFRIFHFLSPGSHTIPTMLLPFVLSYCVYVEEDECAHSCLYANVCMQKLEFAFGWLSSKGIYFVFGQGLSLGHEAHDQVRLDSC